MSIKECSIDRRVRKTKKALSESLISLMQKKEFRGISISEIVGLAELNRGTFYKHYQYKEDLLEEVIDDVMTDLIRSYREPYLHIDTFELSNLTSSSIKIFEHVARYSTFYTIIVNSNVLPGFQNKICNEFKNISKLDLEKCYPTHNINNELLASYSAYAILGMIIEWVQEGFKYSPSYMAEQLLEIINHDPKKVVYKTKLFLTL
jgi:AcrR family transcriptional regulator